MKGQVLAVEAPGRGLAHVVSAYHPTALRSIPAATDIFFSCTLIQHYAYSS